MKKIRKFRKVSVKDIEKEFNRLLDIDKNLNRSLFELSRVFCDVWESALVLSKKLDTINENEDKTLDKNISEFAERMYRIKEVLTDLYLAYWSIDRSSYFKSDFEIPVYFIPHCETEKSTPMN
ncbi:MAG: hypothetical protein ACI4MN_04140 [Candidatus Coproplasma sp.]